MVHPMLRSRAACSSVSTPSPIDRRCRASAMCTTASTMAESGESVPRPATKEGSMVTVSTGRSFSWRSDVDVEPKASTWSRTPRESSAFQVGASRAVLRTADSAISRRRLLAGRPAVASEVALGEFLGGDVDADGHGQAVTPADRLPDGLRQHPPAEFDDQAGALGRRDEVRRQQDAPLGMLPAQQRLDPDDLPGAELDPRLVQEPQLTVHDGPAQLDRDAPEPGGGGGALRGEHLVPTTAERLRPVHRPIGVLHEDLGPVVASGRHGDAHAGRGQRLAVLDGQGRRDGTDHALADGPGGLLALDVLAEHDELVTGEAGDGVLGTGDAEEPAGDGDEELVTDVVAELVVDEFEVVEVDEQHRH